MTQPVRLAIVVEHMTFGNANGRVNLEIAKAAAYAGWEVTCIAAAVDEHLHHQANIRWVTMPWPGLSGYMIGHQVFDLAVRAYLKRNEGRFDLVLGNGNATTWPVDINICHMVHRFRENARTRGPAKSARWRQFAPRSLYHRLDALRSTSQQERAFVSARRVVAVGAHVEDQLEAVGVSQANIHVIHNGVDLDEFHPGQCPSDLLSIPNDPPLALFAGDLSSNNKNLTTALHAMKDLPHLHLAVSGRMKTNRFRNLSQSLQVAERTHFLGYRDDMPALMRRADVLVFPSYYESFGLVLLEALASGLPVVTAKTVGASFIAKEAGLPIIDDPGDAPALAAAIGWVLDDPARYQQARSMARCVAQRYSWASMAERYLDLCRDVCEDKARTLSSPEPA